MGGQENTHAYATRISLSLPVVYLVIHGFTLSANLTSLLCSAVLVVVLVFSNSLFIQIAATSLFLLATVKGERPARHPY